MDGLDMNCKTQEARDIADAHLARCLSGDQAASAEAQAKKRKAELEAAKKRILDRHPGDKVLDNPRLQRRMER